MTEDKMAVLEMLRKAMVDGDADVLREGVRVLAEALMEVEVTALTGVPKGERAPERRLTNRNGYRERRWDTRVGTIELSIPKVRDGSYFPSLLEPRRRAERALLSVVQEAYVAGGQYAPGGRPRRSARDRIAEQERGQPGLCRARQRGRGLPQPLTRRRVLSVSLARCDVREGARGGPCGEHGGAGGDRGVGHG